MKIIETSLLPARIVEPAKIGDSRGFFSETYHRKKLAEFGIDLEFVQDNHSLSVHPGVVRGLHFQIPPDGQAKLIRVVRGAIRDVIVDIRKSSPNFGKHLSVELSAENHRQLFVPIGFAHGFVTLEPNTEVIYKVSAYYAPASDRGLYWNDPALGINWGIDADSATLSDRDKKHPMLDALPAYFD